MHPNKAERRHAFVKKIGKCINVWSLGLCNLRGFFVGD